MYQLTNITTVIKAIKRTEKGYVYITEHGAFFTKKHTRVTIGKTYKVQVATKNGFNYFNGIKGYA